MTTIKDVIYTLHLVKEWAFENPVTVFVIALLIYQKFIENDHSLFPKEILSSPYFLYSQFVIFGICLLQFAYATIIDKRKYKVESAIRPRDKQLHHFDYDGFIRISHLTYDLFSIWIFLIYLFPLLGGSVNDDLRKAMIFADFYGLVIVPFIVSVHFGLKKMRH